MSGGYNIIKDMTMHICCHKKVYNWTWAKSMRIIHGLIFFKIKINVVTPFRLMFLHVEKYPFSQRNTHMVEILERYQMLQVHYLNKNNCGSKKYR